MTEDSATIEVFDFDAAGLRLSERYADWDRQPFGPASSAYISVDRPA